MSLRLSDWTLWHKTTYLRKSGFRIEEETESRIVIRTRNYWLLLGGMFFLGMGFALVWLGFSKASGKTGPLVMLLAFAAVCALFGLAVAWASRTQRDTIVVDRNLGTLRSERAKKRRRQGESPFRIEERPLEDLDCLGFRVASGSASLSFSFRKHRDVHVDNATEVEHLKALGVRLAAVAGVALREHS